MYQIIGADLREYGPVSGEQIRQWLAEGRVDAQTKARREGEGGWKPMGDMPEFAGQFRVSGPWLCPECGERLEAQFDSCWRCATPRARLAAAAAPPSPGASQDAPPAVAARTPKINWRVEHRTFRGGLMTAWDELFTQASEFATEIGRERLIGISHSEDHNKGVIAVWYWSGAGESPER